LEEDVGEYVEKSDISHLRDLMEIAGSKGLTLPQGMLWINESGWDTLRRFKESTWFSDFSCSISPTEIV